MIETEHFTVGHIGRTAGDAVNFILNATLWYMDGKAYYKSDSMWGTDKHRPFDGSEKFRVLGFRRLPSYVLSIRQHHLTYARVSPVVWTSDFCCKLCNGDNELKRITCNNSYSIDHWLRCEYLRDDICALLTKFYDGDKFTFDAKAVLYSASTKTPVPYDHNVFNFFTSKQIDSLYSLNPQWTQIEQELYGSILA